MSTDSSSDFQSRCLEALAEEGFAPRCLMVERDESGEEAERLNPRWYHFTNRRRAAIAVAALPSLLAFLTLSTGPYRVL
jgi:hypothetical protein